MFCWFLGILETWQALSPKVRVKTTNTIVVAFSSAALSQLLSFMCFWSWMWSRNPRQKLQQCWMNNNILSLCVTDYMITCITLVLLRPTSDWRWKGLTFKSWLNSVPFNTHKQHLSQKILRPGALDQRMRVTYNSDCKIQCTSNKVWGQLNDAGPGPSWTISLHTLHWR